MGTRQYAGTSTIVDSLETPLSSTDKRTVETCLNQSVMLHSMPNLPPADFGKALAFMADVVEL
jgi:hypothetical protein